MGRRISVVGGDMRQVALAEGLIKDGFDASVFGFDLSIYENISPTLTEALSGSKTIILGITPCDEKMNISTPLWQGTLSATDLILNLSSDCVIIGGKLSPSFIALCEQKNIKCIDYINREDFAVLNALPTAEGAIYIAMRELEYTISSCKCLVTGFGRIGKILAKSLDSLGADVTCTARKCGDIARIKTSGYKAFYTDSLHEIVHDYDLIFNTIPSKVFDRKVLRNVRTDTFIIDLASKPGGVDFDYAIELGIKTEQALSLPGKIFPKTAGKIIKDTVINILNEM